MTEEGGFVSLYLRMYRNKILTGLILFLICLTLFPLLNTAFSQYVCNQNCAPNIYGCNAPLTCYNTGTTQVCRNPNCLTDVDCVCPTPTNTPTPTPTPIPKWSKLKDASFSSINSLSNPMPAVVVAYDGDDNTNRTFIITAASNVPGSVDAQSIDLNGASKSSKDWYTTAAQGFSKTTSMTPTDFLSYVKSRKDYSNITNLHDISTNGYNNKIVVTSGNLTVDDSSINTSSSNLNNKNLVIVVFGDLQMNTVSFAPTSANIAFLVTGKITFADTTTYGKGIFVAPTIDIGTSANQGLKIVGNLIAQTTLTNNRKWAVNSKPSLFILFDKSQYLSLLPYLSVSNYNWQQLK